VGNLHAEGSEQVNCFSTGTDVERRDTSTSNMYICTWNVEGLTDLKLYQICTYMKLHDISICCIQETRKPMSDYYFAEGGFKVILSGSSSTDREWAGVGFIVSPASVNSIVGFCQVSNWVASLKVRIVGGTAAVF
jgi:exonuclease III